MLALTCERARLANGDRILELGCGWGSLSLWMAANYPDASITAVSDSRTQKEHIDGEGWRRGLADLLMVTCQRQPAGTPRRQLRSCSSTPARSMSNFRRLRREGLDGATLLHGWHRAQRPPAAVFPARPARRVALAGYPAGNPLTSKAWLQNMDRYRAEFMSVLARTHGAAQARRWWVYWREFCISSPNCGVMPTAASGRCRIPWSSDTLVKWSPKAVQSWSWQHATS